MVEQAKPIKILLLEDDDDDYLLAIKSIKNDRLLNLIYRVKDGVEGLKFLNKTKDGFANSSLGTDVPYEEAPDPDIIIADLQMPRMNGREFVIEVKKNRNWRRIPVVILTNSADERDVAQLYDVGAAAYIVKPINVEEMGRIVKEIRDFYLSIVRLVTHEE